MATIVNDRDKTLHNLTNRTLVGSCSLVPSVGSITKLKDNTGYSVSSFNLTATVTVMDSATVVFSYCNSGPTGIYVPISTHSGVTSITKTIATTDYLTYKSSSSVVYFKAVATQTGYSSMESTTFVPYIIEGDTGSQGPTGPTGGTGSPGPSGASSYKAYRIYNVGAAPTTALGTTTYPTVVPTGWSSSTLTPTNAGEALYVVDGSGVASTGSTITWGIPYQAYFKVGSLSAITASMGSLTVDSTLTMGASGVINFPSNGVIKGGKGSYPDAATSGFFLGYSSGYVFRIGNSTNYLDWNGSSLTMYGAFSTTTAAGSKMYTNNTNELLFTNSSGTVVLKLNEFGVGNIYANSAGNITSAITGVTSSASGTSGVVGQGVYCGVSGTGSGTYGMYGSGGTYGVYGTGSSYGVYGNSTSSIGVYGKQGSGAGVGDTVSGVYGSSSGGYGVYGSSSSNNSAGVAGYGSGGAHGLRGNSSGSCSGLVATAGGWSFYAETNTQTGGTKSPVGNGYGPFTGGHDSLFSMEEELEIGDILVDTNINYKKNVSDVLTCTTKSTKPNQKGVVGVSCNYLVPLTESFIPTVLLDDELPHDPSYERAPPSAIYHEIKDQYMYTVMNSLGEGQVNVCGENGNLEIGDLIVSSSMPGKGMKQSDDIIRSYTVAKCRENVTFSSPTEVKMVACIYLCG